MSKWQPIDTAPKDGTPILGYYNGDMATVYYRSGEWILVVAGTYAEDDEWYPTHWFPLPEAPHGV